MFADFCAAPPQERIRRHKYHGMAGLESDVLLLCKNARTYNLEGSVIYRDSLELERAFYAAKAELGSAAMDVVASDNEDGSVQSEVIPCPPPSPVWLTVCLACPSEVRSPCNHYVA